MKIISKYKSDGILCELIDAKEKLIKNRPSYCKTSNKVIAKKFQPVLDKKIIQRNDDGSFVSEQDLIAVLGQCEFCKIYYRSCNSVNVPSGDYDRYTCGKCPIYKKTGYICLKDNGNPYDRLSSYVMKYYRREKEFDYGELVRHVQDVVDWLHELFGKGR